MSASSKKSTLPTPAGVTIVGVPSSVMPTMPTLTPPNLWILYGGKIVFPFDL